MRPHASQSAQQAPLSQALYRAWGRVGLLAFAPRGAALTVILISLSAGGCSFSRGGGDGPFARMTDNDTTGSLKPPEPEPTESDLAFARNAASDVLTKGDKDSSQPWQNPETGAGGNITPLATSYSEDGRPCRDFLASSVHGGSQDWLQGAACRTADGAWEVQRLKPLGHG